MERSFKSRSARSKGKPSHGSAGSEARVPGMKERAQLKEGNYLAVKSSDAVKMVVGAIGNTSTGKDFIPSKLSRKSLKEGGARPMKALIAEEMSKDTDRRQAPGVVAKLMGLEPLPTQHQTRKQRIRLSENCNRKTMFEIQDNYYPYREPVFPKNRTAKDLQEFKDIHEVLQSPNVEKSMSIPIKKETTSARLNVEKEAHIRKKFMDAKHLLTDKNSHRLKDFNDALEALDSNKDLSLKILQEPNSLLEKHLHDLQSLAPSAHTTVLKLSKASRQGKSDTCSNRKAKTKERKMEKCVVCPSHKLLKLLHEGKTVPYLPTKIIVLKTNVGTAQTSDEVVPLPNSLASSYVTYRRHRETQRSCKGDSLPEANSRTKVARNVEHAKERQKGSREIAREITHQMRLSADSGSVSNISTMGRKGLSLFERSCTHSSTQFLSDHKASKKPASSNCQNRDASCIPSSSHFTESYVNREAKRRLSERWKMTRTSQEANGCKVVNTLGEMLAFDDRINQPASSDSMIARAGSSDRSMGRWPSPSGISSREGWKDVCPSNLTKSRSLPASSTLHENLNINGSCEASSEVTCSTMREMVHECGEIWLENCSDERNYSTSRSIELANRDNECIFLEDAECDNCIQKSHLQQNELLNSHQVRNLSEEEPFSAEACLHEATNSDHVLKNLSEVKEVAFDQNDPIIEDDMSNQCQAESHLDTIDSASHLASIAAEQPSPVSVLEPLSDEDLLSADCFEKVSADLHELRRQLTLLKMDSTEVSSEVSCPTVSSDEEAENNCDSFTELNEPVVVKEKNRDFSFIHDALVTSGLDASLKEVLFATRNSSEFPMNPDVFKKLDEKYTRWQTWSRGERRLLFDRMNCILAEILGTGMDERPWVKTEACRKVQQLGWSTEALAEKIWKLLINQGNGGSLDSPGKALRNNILWIDFTDDLDKIGQEMQGFLFQELIEEVVLELLVLR